jgi:hypothetical protein
MATMPKIMPDHDVAGQFFIFICVWNSLEWLDIWQPLGCQIYRFANFGLGRGSPDSQIWEVCQQHGIVLLTGNRNDDGPDSLEATMQRLNTPQSLPVLTIADARRVMFDHQYARLAAVQVLDYLLDIDKVRGAMRLYVP